MEATRYSASEVLYDEGDIHVPTRLTPWASEASAGCM